MKNITLPSFWIILILLTGCAMKPLGYFYVEPYAKPFLSKLNRPLKIVLLDEVKDSLVVEGEGIRKMKVISFRKSVMESMKHTFEKNFTAIDFQDSKPDTGLTLVIYRIKPFWKLNSASLVGSGSYTYTKSFISAAFKFETSLFLGNKKINSADATVYSDDQASTTKQVHAVFKSGLLEACETINKSIFEDEVVKNIREQ